MLSRFLLSFVALSLSTSAWAAHDHSDWNSLLKRNVVVTGGGTSSKVNYARFKTDRAKLKTYLDSTSSVSQATFNKWSKNDQLAFLINAYNAWTVELILTEYPNLKSIKDLGSIIRSPWKQKFIPLFGKTVSLDHIEHTLIRGSGRYNEPRIHFAVNCASIGCPALRNSAYRGNTLSAQLQTATKDFLRDRSRNRLKDGKLQVSNIFKWYRGDFEKGWRGAQNLNQFLAIYAGSLDLTKGQQAALKSGKIKVSFLSYDWRLNRIR
ncbi:DUF547 domain-containing protein [Parasphingorhabdus cellanae]|uniref:DUF547 domain-containing protein n=1 Tax=Parasphingorhabdus cellanae TaxID=2806553 RepID=A0ABX7T5H6_9SPHN|nr:DUF547 domain-containing protein [Parasphingorhabdus cellanae]QTD56791.1 DUF547 domain-containing protein [Parasphingorhabdus cellanae]